MVKNDVMGMGIERVDSLENVLEASVEKKEAKDAVRAE